MQCPRCGGWHGGTGPAPKPTVRVTGAVPVDEAKVLLAGVRKQAARDPYSRDVLPEGNRVWEPRVYGTDEQGREVTAAFGRPGTSKEGQTMIAGDHVPGWRFYQLDAAGLKGHDHAGEHFYVDRRRAP
jgi:hypothetical protein